MIVGLNVGLTKDGRSLRDGGTCILDSFSGRVMAAVSEERISRRKTDGGYGRSLSHCFEFLNASFRDVELVVLSTCAEDATVAAQPTLTDFATERVIVCPSHHYSHALSAYLTSPFDEAIVVVLDAGGTVLESSPAPWWACKREQHTYYLGSGNGLTLIGRDFVGPYEAGVGELFRAFTHFLGWKSYIHSSKTMGLAAFGDPNRFGTAHIFRENGSGYRSCVANQPTAPESMVKQLGQSMAIDVGEPRLPGEPLTQLHADIAVWIQSETERVVLDIVRRLVAKTGIRNLCLAGGVALNCRLNSRLLASGEIAQLYIQPAAGDQGQCLGNALYGLSMLRTGMQRLVFDDVYFGRQYDVTVDQIHRLVGGRHKVSRPSELCRVVAQYLLDGHIVGWFQGGAEFGPRALGHRSILASPLNAVVKSFLNEHIKRREPIMPYAASILEEFASEYFELSVPSPFMLLAPKLRPSKAADVPALGHADRTVRLQTVSKSSLTLFRELIMAFYQASGVPMLLNTSLNGAGEPIAESPRDALSCFERHDIDHLVIGPWLISKRQIDSAAKVRLSTPRAEHADIGQCA